MQEKAEYNSTVKIVQTDIGTKNGQTKCPKCGATDISINTNNGYLRCNFCRYEFVPEKVVGMVEDLSRLEGQIIGTGASNIVLDTQDMVTFKCSSCGAEVVIDTSLSIQARCHWCRNTLSVNQQIPNGRIPDVVLPFSVNKASAQEEIEKFVGKRKFFAHPKFKAEFKSDNIMGVYFPYLLVDVNAHTYLFGQGEKETKKYFKGSGSNRKVYYDADLYQVEREFDLLIHGLSVEANSNRRNTKNNEQTNNIINAIMPFDIENCVRYDANYLKGYTSERRDTNIDDLRSIVDIELKDIARFACNETILEYNRGVEWSSEQFVLKGQQWKSAYLPVWLYSYQEVNGSKKRLHYVCVNARTRETMGSVPIHIPKLIGVSVLVEIIGILTMIFIDWKYNFLCLFLGIIYFIIIFMKYRNTNARHTYETNTKTEIGNVRKVDDFIQSRTGLVNDTMIGANNKKISHASVTNQIFDKVIEKDFKNTMVNSVVQNDSLTNFIKNNIEKRGGRL